MRKNFESFDVNEASQEIQRLARVERHKAQPIKVLDALIDNGFMFWVSDKSWPEPMIYPCLFNPLCLIPKIQQGLGEGQRATDTIYVEYIDFEYDRTSYTMPDHVYQYLQIGNGTLWPAYYVNPSYLDRRIRMLEFYPKSKPSQWPIQTITTTQPNYTSYIRDVAGRFLFNTYSNAGYDCILGNPNPMSIMACGVPNNAVNYNLPFTIYTSNNFDMKECLNYFKEKNQLNYNVINPWNMSLMYAFPNIDKIKVVSDVLLESKVQYPLREQYIKKRYYVQRHVRYNKNDQLTCNNGELYDLVPYILLVQQLSSETRYYREKMQQATGNWGNAQYEGMYSIRMRIAFRDDD